MNMIGETKIQYGVVSFDEGGLIEVIEKPTLRLFDDGTRILVKGDRSYLATGTKIKEVAE